MKWIIPIICCFLIQNCDNAHNQKLQEHSEKVSIAPSSINEQLLDTSGKFVHNRINAPKNYTRSAVLPNSFAQYLKKLPLKPHGSEVKYYNGTIKPNNQIYDAVIDLPIGNKNLHQCADAIMRLKAAYHWGNKEYEKIHFNFTNGFKVDYSKWMDGFRMKINGNKTNWEAGPKRENDYEDFWEFMELIFTYAGTASLEKELKSIELSQMQIGDVFIKGGHPGHAVIVLDMAKNVKGEQLFMLGQSYMPAQEIQILKNNQASEISPWYRLNDFEVLNTPEWSFNADQLKRFVE